MGQDAGRKLRRSIERKEVVGARAHGSRICELRTVSRQGLVIACSTFFMLVLPLGDHNPSKVRGTALRTLRVAASLLRLRTASIHTHFAYARLSFDSTVSEDGPQRSPRLNHSIARAPVRSTRKIRHRARITRSYTTARILPSRSPVGFHGMSPERDVARM